MEGTVRMKTALQQLIEWGDQMMAEHPLKVLSFAEAIDKAEELLEVEKEQLEKAFNEGSFANDEKVTSEEYYNEQYGK
jgi:hypothetical protein